MADADEEWKREAERTNGLGAANAVGVERGRCRDAVLREMEAGTAAGLREDAPIMRILARISAAIRDGG